MDNDSNHPKKSRMTRLEANRKIMRLLARLVETYPDQRFGQLMCNYVLTGYREHDPFFEESTETLGNISRITDVLKANGVKI